MYILEVESDFSAAHQLREYQGKCENLHGHNWRVRVAVSGENLDRSGMLLDFGELKRILNECTAPLDHVFLNDLETFGKINPTSENIACYLSLELQRRLPEDICVTSVTVWESDKCRATYYPPKRTGNE